MNYFLPYQLHAHLVGTDIIIYETGAMQVDCKFYFQKVAFTNDLHGLAKAQQIMMSSLVNNIN